MPVAAALAVAASAVGCSTETEPGVDPPVGTGEDAEDGRRVVTVDEMAMSRGVQYRLVRYELDDTSIVAVLEVSSGAQDTGELRPGDIRLVDQDDERIDAAADTAAVALVPGEDVHLEVRFEPAGGTDDLDEVTLRVPGAFGLGGPIELGPLRLDEPRSAAPLPDPISLAESAAHPQGTQVEVDGLSFTESRIGAQMTFRNAGQSEVIWAAAESTYLEDDLGHQYQMVAPVGEEPLLEVAGGAERAGIASFAGRVHPEATELTLTVNGGIGGSADRALTVKPRVVLGPWSITGDDGDLERDARPRGLPLTIEVGETRTHPSGSEATLQSVRFEADVIRADLTIMNNASQEQWVIGSGVLQSSYLVDDSGRRHRPLIDDEEQLLEIPPGQGAELDLVLGGRIDPGATSFDLWINEGTVAGREHRTTPAPTFGWEGIAIPDLDGTETETEPTRRNGVRFEVGSHSELSGSDLDRTSIEVVARIVTSFDGIETDDGVLLTVPDHVLFDFGSASLRADGRQRIADLGAVLDHYGDAPATVVGHTDHIGSAESNQRLSERRAAAVVEALVTEHGVDPGRLTAIGHGESDPVAPNAHADGSDNPEGRQQNRRVELLIQTDEGLPPG